MLVRNQKLKGKRQKCKVNVVNEEEELQTVDAGVEPSSRKAMTSQRAMITEVEAYKGEEDQACHARFGKTERTKVMYEEAGRVYMYLIYGMHWMLNVVTGEEGEPQAVLVRGVWLMNDDEIPDRLASHGRQAVEDDKLDLRSLSSLSNEEDGGGNVQGQSLSDSQQLTPSDSPFIKGGEVVGGPGKLTKALGLDGSFYEEDLVTSERLWIGEDDRLPISDDRIKRTERIGFEYAGEWVRKKWRWVV